MFVLRGSPEGKRGQLLTPKWDGKALRFAYHGADNVLRTLLVEFSRTPVLAPITSEQSIAHFQLDLAPMATEALMVTCRVDERPVGSATLVSSRAPLSVLAMREAQAAASAALLDGYAGIETASQGLGEVLARSLTDIALLKVRRGEHRFTTAGIPWFVGLFGRDSLLPTIQCLAYNPALGARTAKALAHWQGTKDDPFTMEQPGKILHELRVGELTHLHEVSQTPSYASVDATLLFLVAIAKHVLWTGNVRVFEALRSNVDRALSWLDRKTAENAAGYVTYDGLADHGQPINQSWRNSGTGVLRSDGSYPRPPLALVEVQGYAFQTRRLIATVLRRVGEDDPADRLDAAANKLQERFLRDFWMEGEGCYCLGLEQGERQITSVTSNAAQVLWTGIATVGYAKNTAERIMRPDMFSGWGIRTLSADHATFDPLAYQQGSVWAFDNAPIVSGLRRYGEDDAALRVTAATLDAARGFRNGRLPEFIAGAQRLPGDAPPRADPLQAWSAAAIPLMVSELLGLDADGFGKRLHVRRPLLPDGVDTPALHRVSIGEATVSLRFTRHADGASATVIANDGSIEVIVG